jgi:hypothetical protein
MKIRVLISLIILIFCIDVWAEYPWVNETIYYSPKGNVNYVNIKTFILDVEKRTLKKYQKLYIDGKKAIRKLFSYKPDGTLYEIIVVEVNSDGFVTSYKEYDGDRRLLWKQTKKYDDNNNQLKRELCKKGDNSCSVYLYRYDSEDRIIKEENYYTKSKLNDNQIIEYGDNRKKTSTYNSNGDLEDYYIEVFNTDGNRVEFAAYDSKGDMTAKLVSKYNGKRIIQEHAEYFLSGENDTYTYKYIDSKNEQTKLKYKNNELIEKENKVFDGNKLVSHLVEEYKDGEIDESVYKQYDKIGNIILKRTFEDNRTLETIYEYEYVD